jgi:hypothetical protein
MLSSWQKTVHFVHFRPEDEKCADRFRADDGGAGCDGTVANRSAPSDAASVQDAQGLGPLCGDGNRPADVLGELEGIETYLSARPSLANHMGIRGRVTRNNLAYANEHRDWRVFSDVAAVLMRRAQRLSAEIPAPLGLGADLFALDATVIELGMALFPWARRKQSLASVELNVLLDLRGDIPVSASLHEGKKHEVASLDDIPVHPGSYYVMDRGYLDFAHLCRLHQADAFFATRLKSNTCFYVTESRPVDESTRLRSDQTIKPNPAIGHRDYPGKLRRIRFIDPETGKTLVFVTNQFDLEALIVAEIY